MGVEDGDDVGRFDGVRDGEFVGVRDGEFVGDVEGRLDGERVADDAISKLSPFLTLIPKMNKKYILYIHLRIYDK